MEDRQVEDDERELEGHAEADHEEELHVDVVLEVGQGRGDGIRLTDEPLEARRDDDEVAEDRAQEEQHRGGEHRGHDPLALVGAQRRQEECQDLPDDHGRAHDHGELEREREAQREATERGGDVELAVGHEGADGVLEDIEDHGRRKVEHDGGGEDRDDDDRQTATELSQMIEERHSGRSDRHYSSPPLFLSAAAASFAAASSASSAASSAASSSTTALCLRGRRA